MASYDEEFKIRIVRMHMEEGRTIKSLSEEYRKGSAQKVFENILKRQFTVPLPEKFWCTDFTYIHWSDGSMCYKCTIIDLYDWSVASML